MTDEEKQSYKTHETTWGYIKVSKIETDIKVHRRRAFYSCNDLDDIRKTLDIPNFDYGIFEEISWISKEDFDKKLWINTERNLVGKEAMVEIDGKKYKVKVIE